MAMVTAATMFKNCHVTASAMQKRRPCPHPYSQIVRGLHSHASQIVKGAAWDLCHWKQVLALHMRRGVWVAGGRYGAQYLKLGGQVSFPEVLDLQPYTCEGENYSRWMCRGTELRNRQVTLQTRRCTCKYTRRDSDFGCTR